MFFSHISLLLVLETSLCLRWCSPNSCLIWYLRPLRFWHPPSPLFFSCWFSFACRLLWRSSTSRKRSRFPRSSPFASCWFSSACRRTRSSTCNRSCSAVCCQKLKRLLAPSSTPACGSSSSSTFSTETTSTAVSLLRSTASIVVNFNRSYRQLAFSCKKLIAIDICQQRWHKHYTDSTWRCSWGRTRGHSIDIRPPDDAAEADHVVTALTLDRLTMQLRQNTWSQHWH